MGALVSLFSFNVCFRFYFLFSPLARSVFGIAYFFLSVARLFSFFFSPRRRRRESGFIPFCQSCFLFVFSCSARFVFFFMRDFVLLAGDTH